MSGTQRARTALGRALRVALTVLCVVLLCVLGTGQSGPSPATADGARPSPTAPAEPTEAPADPIGDPEVRQAVRVTVRGFPGLRRPVFHVKHPGFEELGPRPAGTTAAAAPPWVVRSVVLRC
ncbi:hypothetical protein J7F03_03890 [Streptomyces sp. ISL-43]|uniref:hypothetical protein n=1 Tax=Streptomyces sp. ISL-43 TaxID=2819183 RepID=UPI001BE8530D|nr:hypothetical protein [Streptomyces sp. ISL-43]MBT2446238.1 hypothetical protein [Streptomyces sp. ISL-43]